MSPQCNDKGKKNYLIEKSIRKDLTPTKSHNF